MKRQIYVAKGEIKQNHKRTKWNEDKQSTQVRVQGNDHKYAQWTQKNGWTQWDF